MAWTHATEEDWRDSVITAALWNELVNAVIERHKALNGGDAPGGLIAEVSAADEITAARAAALQQWIEDNYGSFIVAADAGTLRGAGHFDGVVDADPWTNKPYGNLAAVFDAAGLETATWRAYVKHPNDGGVDQARQAASGDIIGAWVPRDIQACLNVLVWQYYGDTTDVNTAGGETNDRHAGNDTGMFYPWDDAKTYCDDAYDTGPPGTYEDFCVDSTVEDKAAVAWTAGQCARSWAPDFKVQQRRTYAYGHVTGLWTGIKHSIDWYSWTTRYSGYDESIYSAYGDGYTENQLKLDETTTGVTDASTTTATKLGRAIINRPSNDDTWCNEPPLETLGPWNIKGYWGWWFPVIRWNVAGGFTYAMGDGGKA